MAINHVQFQKGLSMAAFMDKYGTQKQCHAALVASRWPEGFRCPYCGDEHTTYSLAGAAAAPARQAARSP